LALEILQQLDQARSSARKGLGLSQLAQQLQVDALQLEPVLETLTTMDWIGQLNDAQGQGADEARYLLLTNPDATALEPLMQQLLLDKAPSVSPLWEKARWSSLQLRDAL